MSGITPLQWLYVVCALLFELALIIHFSLRKWRFDWIVRHGWWFYAFSVPLAAASLIVLLGGESWSFWLGGFLYLAWAIYGYVVEFALGITTWRKPIRWSVFVPYVTLYLVTAMFYWWPLWQLGLPLWIVGAALYALSTFLNAISHNGPDPSTE